MIDVESEIKEITKHIIFLTKEIENLNRFETKQKKEMIKKIEILNKRRDKWLEVRNISYII